MKKLLFMFCLVTAVSDLMAANINIGPNGCTLADAIDSANFNSAVGNCAAGSGTDFIIAPDNWEFTISSPLPTVASDVTFRSASPAGIFYILGDDAHRVLKIVGNNTNVTLNRVQIGGGKTGLISGDGAGIRIENATVRLENSIVVSNESQGFGSGIYVVNGDLTIDHSEVQANKVGAGVYAVDSTVHIVNSTFTHNPGGGMRLKDSELLVENSLFNEFRFGISGEGTVAEINNSTFVTTIPNPNDRPSAFAFFGFSAVTLNHITAITESRYIDSLLSVSNSFIGACEMFTSNLLLSSHNLYQSNFGNIPPNCLGLERDNHGLSNLADNGGPTQTKAIWSVNSEAINAGDPVYCQEFDQRGELRDSQCDVGAFEVTGLADVQVNSRIEPGPPFASNQQITYYAEIKNNGPGIATHVEMGIDANFAFVDSVDSAFCNAVDCIIGSIQSGQTLVIPIQMTLASYFNSPFQVELTAHTSASSTYIDGDEDDVDLEGVPTGNNYNITSYDIHPAADLAIEMDLLTSEPYGIGQTVQYEAIITNHGPQTASGIALEFLPDNLSISLFSGCTSVSGGICNLANIANGGSRNVVIQAKIDDTQFNAVATVGSGLFDPDTSNNTDDERNGGGVNKSDIQVRLEVVDLAPYTSLQYIQFKIFIGGGEEPASNIRLYYEFPGAEYITIDGCADYPCVIPNLAANAEVELNAQFFAPLAIPGTIDTWSMRVLALPGQLDPDLSNNEDTIVMPLKPVADVAAQLNLISEPPFYAGQEIQYSLRVINGGPNSVTSVDVSLEPQNLSLLYAEGYLCPTVDCLIAQLNAFDEENITLFYQIDDIGAFDLTGIAKAAELDNNLANNTDSSNNGGLALEPPLPDKPNEIFNDGFE